MIIDLITLENSPFEFNFTLAPEETGLEGEEVKLISETSVKGVLTKKTAETDVEGMIRTDAEFECTRCLTPVGKKFEVPFQAVFISPEYYSAEKETELGTDDLDVSVTEDDKINLTDLVREQILLNLPEKILCREDCKGLCPQCGANRNEKDCSCEQAEIDPRWTALKNLK